MTAECSAQGESSGRAIHGPSLGRHGFSSVGRHANGSVAEKAPVGVARGVRLVKEGSMDEESTSWKRDIPICLSEGHGANPVDCARGPRPVPDVHQYLS